MPLRRRWLQRCSGQAVVDPVAFVSCMGCYALLPEQHLGRGRASGKAVRISVVSVLGEGLGCDGYDWIEDCCADRWPRLAGAKNTLPLSSRSPNSSWHQFQVLGCPRPNRVWTRRRSKTVKTEVACELTEVRASAWLCAAAPDSGTWPPRRRDDVMLGPDRMGFSMHSVKDA